MRNPFVRRAVWILILIVLTYTAFVIWSDFRKNLEVLRAFPWRILPILLGSVLVNFLVRELKWNYYRKQGGIDVPRLGNFLIFFSGYSMAISPARAGELIKPFMYKEYFDQKMRRTIPLVFCERLSDLLGMIVLAAVTVVPFMGAVSARNSLGTSTRLIYGFLVFSAVFMLVLVWFIRQKPLAYRFLMQLSHWTRSRRKLWGITHKLRKLYFATYPLLTMRNLIITTAMAAFSWFFECLALKLILDGIQHSQASGAGHVGITSATFIFCMATIFGGFLFFLPGGIGGFEAMVILMLGLIGIPKFEAVPAVFITRVCTLFYSVVLGFIFILITSAKYHKRMEWDEFEHDSESD